MAKTYKFRIGDVVFCSGVWPTGVWCRVKDTWYDQKETGVQRYSDKYRDPYGEEGEDSWLEEGHYWVENKKGTEWDTHQGSLTLLDEWEGRVKPGHPAYENALHAGRAVYANNKNWHKLRPALDRLITAVRVEKDREACLAEFGPEAPFEVTPPPSVQQQKVPKVSEDVLKALQGYGSEMFVQGLEVGLEVASLILRESEHAPLMGREEWRQWSEYQIRVARARYRSEGKTSGLAPGMSP